MAYLNTPQSRSIGMGARIYDAWSTYRAEYRQNALYRETTRQLGGLTDRQLDDIGVSRHDISHVEDVMPWDDGRELGGYDWEGDALTRGTVEGGSGDAKRMCAYRFRNFASCYAG